MTKLSETVSIHSAAKLVVAVACVFVMSAQACGDSGSNNLFGENQSPENNPVDSCVVDDDCSGSERCARGACSLTCVSDDDCGAGSICRTEFRNDEGDVVDVCVDDPDSEPTMECRFDADCQETFDDPTARCGIDGICFVPEQAHSLLIRDVTDLSGVDLGTPAADGGHGADIAAVYLVDPETGEPTAWAETVEAAPANDLQLRNAPDGSPRTLSTEVDCVSGAYELNATPLGGEGGFLLVRFLELDTGKVVNTTPDTWDVRVIEWGDNCPDGDAGGMDAVEVLGCTTAANEPVVLDRDCETVLGSGSGYLEIGSN